MHQRWVLLWQRSKSVIYWLSESDRASVEDHVYSNTVPEGTHSTSRRVKAGWIKRKGVRVRVGDSAEQQRVVM